MIQWRSSLSELILESYLNEFFGSCKCFWIPTIIPLDQNLSTLITLKVIRNHYNFKFFLFSGFIMSFKVTEVFQFWSNGIIVGIQNNLHDPKNSSEYFSSMSSDKKTVSIGFRFRFGNRNRNRKSQTETDSKYFYNRNRKSQIENRNRLKFLCNRIRQTEIENW